MKLRRSMSNYKVAGICGGLSEYFDISASMIRIGFVLAVLIGGLSVLAYLVLWIVIPKNE